MTGAAAGPVNDTLASVAHAVRPDAVPAPAAAGAPPAAVLPAQPVAADPAGLLQPVTATVTGTVDYVIQAVPAVNQIVPSGTVGTVTAPVVAAADSAVAEATQAVLPAASEVLPVLEPVLEPVDELITGTDTLPLPGNVAVASDARAVTDSSAFDGGFGTELGQAPVAQLGAVQGSSGLLLTPKSALSLPVANLGPAHSSSVPAGTSESPGNGDGTPGILELPAVPGSGSASSQSSGAGPGGSAWLSNFLLNVPLTGIFPVSGPLQSPPAPVSFDPGSSPD
ncbi:hypothetical protein [Arthrobacter oryzae]|uniref:hypothetical protein n=1 Tax=Arthrobacter oryzae TaxID=409290 RepID=UPI00285F8FF2|nr:hypothetical protein [Arthrobacter oryzae]MDR6508214.1 hypothetical protein [Arthrobacter oryzae]